MNKQDKNFTNGQVPLATYLLRFTCRTFHRELEEENQLARDHLQEVFHLLFPPMNSILRVKPEITSPRRWPLYMGEGEAPIPAVRPVKRRRRSLGPGNCGNASQGVGLDQPQQLQVDGNNPAAKTVKRSSRFRGVSRFINPCLYHP